MIQLENLILRTSTEMKVRLCINPAALKLFLLQEDGLELWRRYMRSRYYMLGFEPTILLREEQEGSQDGSD